MASRTIVGTLQRQTVGLVFDERIASTEIVSDPTDSGGRSGKGPLGQLLVWLRRFGAIALVGAVVDVADRVTADTSTWTVEATVVELPLMG
jgi:hypothetical protein